MTLLDENIEHSKTPRVSVLLTVWTQPMVITLDTTNTDLLLNYSESIIELNSFQDSGIRLWIIGSWAKKSQNRFTANREEEKTNSFNHLFTAPKPSKQWVKVDRRQ